MYKNITEYRWHQYRDLKNIFLPGDLNVERFDQHITESIKLVEDNEIIISHMDPNNYFKDFHVIHIVREFRQCLVSYLHWCNKFQYIEGTFTEQLLRGITTYYPKWERMTHWQGVANEIWQYDEMATEENRLTLHTPTHSYGTTPRWQSVWNNSLEDALNGLGYIQ